MLAVAVVTAIAAISTPVAAGPPPPSESPAPVYVQILHADDVDTDADTLDFVVARYPAGFYGIDERFKDTTGVIRVAPVGGAPRRVGRFGFEYETGGGSEHSIGPCDIGGRDLPDERFTVSVDLDSDPPHHYERELRLGPDTTKPTVKKIQSSPPPGSKVEPGDKIRFEVVGKEDLPGDTWQTGVQTLQVTGPRGLIDDKSAGRTAKACRNKSESLTINGKYKVKGGDPAVIEICGIAEDYAANEGSTCAKYYKGEVWEGTFRARQEVIGTCSWTYEGPVQVVVAPDGSLTGSGSASYTEVMDLLCTGLPPGGGQATYSISGNRDRNRFNVTLSGPTGSTLFELRVAGKKAEGRIEFGGGLHYTMNLTCKSCEDEAVG